MTNKTSPLLSLDEHAAIDARAACLAASPADVRRLSADLHAMRRRLVELEEQLAAVRDAGRAYLASPGPDRGSLVPTILAAAGVAPSAAEEAGPGIHPWAVLIARDGYQLRTTLVSFETEGNARDYFGRASEQWSGSYLMKVVIGPKDGYPRSEGE